MQCDAISIYIYIYRLNFAAIFDLRHLEHVQCRATNKDGAIKRDFDFWRVFVTVQKHFKWNVNLIRFQSRRHRHGQVDVLLAVAPGDDCIDTSFLQLFEITPLFQSFLFRSVVSLISFRIIFYILREISVSCLALNRILSR